ncbi:hypothetical protein [Janibacter melonis]|uniref:hypothetical protein n=1 Tax=Janibacter melonis TaxID=262209 RepID=UPI0017850938|nr:hypothetical protein [Janibacter melonis]
MSRRRTTFALGGLAVAVALALSVRGGDGPPTSAATGTPVAGPTIAGPTEVGCVARPSRCGYPDETTTGVRDGVTLTPSGSVMADEDGQVIEGLDITGEISVSASDVTIRDVRVTGGRGVGAADWVVVMRPGAERLVIEDSELRTPQGTEQDLACVLNIGDGEPVVRRVDMHGCTIGVATGGGVVEDSYIHDPSMVPDLSHVNGVASMGGGGLTVRRNTILNSYSQTSAVALYQDFGTQSDDLVQHNLLAGGGYIFYGGDGRFGPTSKIRFLDNRISRVYYPKGGSLGVIAHLDLDLPGNESSGNFWDDTGEAL